MTTSYSKNIHLSNLFAYTEQLSFFSSCMSIKTGLFFFLTFCCIITVISGIIDHYCIMENQKKKKKKKKKTQEKIRPN